MGVEKEVYYEKLEAEYSEWMQRYKWYFQDEYRYQLVNQEWRMLAVNFKRALQKGGTDAMVYIDQQPPVSLFFEGVFYADDNTNDVYAGKDFAGLIRAVYVFNYCQRCTKWDGAFEYYKEYYSLIDVNDLEYGNPTCRKRTNGQVPCYTCSLHHL